MSENQPAYNAAYNTTTTHTHGFPFAHDATTSLPASRTMTLAHFFIAPRSKVEILRKMRGSLFTSAFGFEAARQHLRHRDIRTTSSHYVEKKKRVEVSLSIPSSVTLQIAA